MTTIAVSPLFCECFGWIFERTFDRNFYSTYEIYSNRPEIANDGQSMVSHKLYAEKLLSRKMCSRQTKCYSETHSTCIWS